MNANTILTAVNTIDQCQDALTWLEEFGVQLTGRSEDRQANIDVVLNFAGSCVGSKNAAHFLGQYARSMLPEIVEASIRGCKNTIEINREKLRKEIES